MKAGVRRRPATGGYARGDEKKARIIAAALRHFGDIGYDGASTREIAALAGVNPPALQYYFGGKRSLYRACSAYIVDRYTESVTALFERAQAAQTRQQALDSLCDIIDALLTFLLETARTDGFANFIARAMFAEDVGETGRVQEQNTEDELHDQCLRLVCIATELPPHSEEAHLRTFTVTGQVPMFVLGRGIVERKLGWQDITGDRLTKLKRVMRAQTMEILFPRPILG